MDDKELMTLLEIEEWEQLSYYEQFLTLMEQYEALDEERLFNILSKVENDNLISFIESYFEEIMMGIPDDNITLYKIFSSVKGVLVDLASASNRKSAALDSLAYELIRFQNWLMEDDLVECINLNDESVKRISIYDALICTRIELLNEGKYQLVFPEDIDYTIEEYDYISETDYDETDGSYDEEEDEDLYDAIIDPENPVIEEFE